MIIVAELCDLAREMFHYYKLEQVMLKILI
jgi:hypothetical protein